MLYLEGSDDRAAPKPKNINLLDRAQRCVVVVEREPVKEFWRFTLPFLEDAAAITDRNPDRHSHLRSRLGDEGLNSD